MTTVIKDVEHLFTGRSNARMVGRVALIDNAALLDEPATLDAIDEVGSNALGALLELLEAQPTGATVSAAGIAAILALALGQT